MKRHTDNYSSMRRLDRVKTLVMMLLMLMAAGVGEVWGQTVAEDGYYRLQNQNNTTYYLCPSTKEWDTDKPYVTTYSNSINDHSLWKIQHVSDNYYYIIHVLTGKYMTLNDNPMDEINANRVHLEATNSPNDNMLFEISLNGTNWNITPKALTTWGYDKGSPTKYLNPFQGNKNNYTGENNGMGGLIGFWTSSDNGSKWKPIKIAAPAPTITFDNNANTFSISVPDFESTGVTIHYTTDGSTPTASSSTYTTA